MKTGSKIAAIVIVVIVLVTGTVAYLGYFSNTGTAKVYVQDAPISNVTAVYITFSEVALHGNKTGWANYSISSTTVNILGLTTTNASLLKSITLQAERYTMIRLYISSVNVSILGQNYTFTLSSPFAFINHTFVVSAHSSTAIHIEFNLSQDLNLNAKIFTPNIGMVVS